MSSLQDHAQSFGEGREFVFDMIEVFFDDPNFTHRDFQEHVCGVIDTYSTRTSEQRAKDRQKRRDQHKAFEELLKLEEELGIE